MKRIILILLLVLTVGLFACEEPHTHEFVNGSCECGEKHNCTYVDGKCECGKEEEHTHEFVNGSCECGELHNCTYVDGKCECGKQEEVAIDYEAIIKKALDTLYIQPEATDNIPLITSIDVDGETVELKYNSNNSALTIEGIVTRGLEDVDVTLTVTGSLGGKTQTKEFNVKVLKKEINLEALVDWAFEKCGLVGMDEITLPTTHPDYDCTFTWTSGNSELLNVEEGYLEFVEFDEVVDLTCLVSCEGKEYQKTEKFTIRGYAFYDIAVEFIDQFRGKVITGSKKVVSEYPDYYGGTTIEWSSSNEEIFDNEGNLNKPIKDTHIYITYKVTLGEPKKSSTFTEKLLVYGMTADEVLKLVKNWIGTYVGENGQVSSSTIFPTYIDEYEIDLEWLDVYGEPLKLEAFVGNPVFSKGIDVKVKVSYNNRAGYLDLHYDNKAEGMNDKWDEIENFVNTINSLPVHTYTYNLITWQGTTYGYVPFFVQSDSSVKESILPYTYGKQRTGILKTSTEYVVVHDTGNSKAGATAEMHDRYITNLNNDSASTYISWHYTVDDSEIIQHLPLDEVAYHAGDGSTVFGDIWNSTTYGKTDCIGGGNRNGIGIETCVDQGSDYTETMRKTAKLVAELLIQYDLNIDRVKQHWHFSGKNCPQVMRENNRWDEFLNLVQIEYYGKTVLKGVTFEWKSNSDCLDDFGRVKSLQSAGTKLSYEVKVTYGGESKTYTFDSVIKKR